MRFHRAALRTRPRRRSFAVAIVGVVALTAACSSASNTSGTTGSPATFKTFHNASWGPILTLANGYTVYRFIKDPNGSSKCYTQCAVVWPPVELAKGQATPTGSGLTGFGSFARTTGALQVTYKGIPLYTYAGDTKPGDVTGKVTDVFGLWTPIDPSQPFTILKRHRNGGGGKHSPRTTSIVKPPSGPPTSVG